MIINNAKNFGASSHIWNPIHIMDIHGIKEIINWHDNCLMF